MSPVAAAADNLSMIFGKQLEIYKRLTKLVSSISADVARTKGNMSGLSNKFEQENDLIEEIEKLKEEAQPDIIVWQEHKHAENDEEAKKKLDGVLEAVQEEIVRFLNADKILKKQIDFYREKDAVR
jgi:Sec-independent protein translocase protein TatA